MNNNIKKTIILSIAVIFVGLGIAGGTFAWLTMNANITNGSYSAMSHCFLVDYNINNEDGTSDIAGTLFPSSSASGGLSGRVGLKISDGCEIYGNGMLKLHIDNNTDSNLTNSISSYCLSKKTSSKIDGISTEEECNNANGNWMGYGDSYCENPSTLQRMTNYTSETDCTSNGGTWTSGGSPLKYAVYNTTDTTQMPISVGHITSSDIGNDIVIKDNILVSKVQEYYYIYVWLDGYLTDNTFSELQFGGYISAAAAQNNDVGAVNLPSEY